jgi:hypothetical protein
MPALAMPRRTRGPFQPAEATSEEIIGESRTGAEHHMLAAEHHEHAARHHRQASKHYEEKDFAHAAHESLIAHDHTRRAIHHSNEAGKYHAERHGDAKL